MCDPDVTARRVVVIGATGFIGRQVARRLLARGDRVIALVRPGSSRLNELPTGVERRRVGLDPAEPELVAALREADAVVYAAGSVRGRVLGDFLPANVWGVSTVAAHVRAGCPLVLLSSLAAGEPGLSDYARSKRMGEQMLEARGKSASWVILRPTAVYGPGDRELRPLLSLMRRGLLVCPADSAQRLSFIHVNDVATAVVAALDHFPKARGRIYSLDDGTPGGYGRAELARSMRPRGRTWCVRVPRVALMAAARANLAWSACTQRPPMLTPGKVDELMHRSWLGNNAGFTEATGWKPALNLEEGAARLFARGGEG